MKRTLLLPILAGLAIVACTPGMPADLSTPEPRSAEALDWAEARWLALNVNTYHIQVQAVSLWHVQTHDIVVRGGQADDSAATCMTAPLEFGNECRVQTFEPADFTVPGLFAKARTLAGEKWAKIAFDAKYAFPSVIGFNDPEIYDEEWGWAVLLFEGPEE